MYTFRRPKTREKCLITTRPSKQGISWRDLKEYEITIEHIYEKRNLFNWLSKLNELNSEVSKSNLLCAEPLFVQAVFSIK